MCYSHLRFAGRIISPLSENRAFVIVDFWHLHCSHLWMVTTRSSRWSSASSFAPMETSHNSPRIHRSCPHNFDDTTVTADTAQGSSSTQWTAFCSPPPGVVINWLRRIAISFSVLMLVYFCHDLRCAHSLLDKLWTDHFGCLCFIILWVDSSNNHALWIEEPIHSWYSPQDDGLLAWAGFALRQGPLIKPFIDVHFSQEYLHLWSS